MYVLHQVLISNHDSETGGEREEREEREKEREEREGERGAPPPPPYIDTHVT